MAGPKEDFILMMVGGLTLDPTTKMPIVVLKDPDNKLNLPIWIGPLEAASMATEIEGIKPQRPMTHDLMRNLVGELGATVEAVEITELAENTYFARIELKTREGGALHIDSRPLTRSRSPCGPSRQSTSPRLCSKPPASCTNPRAGEGAATGPESRQRLARQMVRNPREDVARRFQVQDVGARRRPSADFSTR